MFNLFKKAKRLQSQKEQTEERKLEGDSPILFLPKEGVYPTIDFYVKDPVLFEKQPKILVHLVSIYNVRELASEIAKCLKEGTNNSSESNDNSDSSPKP